MPKESPTLSALKKEASDMAASVVSHETQAAIVRAKLAGIVAAILLLDPNWTPPVY